MNIKIFYYSLTGNNKILALNLAERLGAQYNEVTEWKERTVWTTAFDMMFNRTPKVSYELAEIQPEDLVIFIAPIWMGSAASPLRDCFKRLRKSIGTFAFISISGGADDNPNPKLDVDLKKRLGKKPAAVIALYIANLLPPVPKPTRDDTSAYRITANDTKKLTEEALSILSKKGVI